MGTGIALVYALRAKVPVLLHDRSPEQLTKGLSLIDKLLAKDVAKGRLTNEQAKEARDRVSVVGREQGIKGLRDVDMVVEVSKCPISSQFMLIGTLQAVSENLSLKQSIFKELAAGLRPEAILATNTSSISITKIAASAIPEGVAPTSEEGKKSASRVVGTNPIPEEVSDVLPLLQDCTSLTPYRSWWLCSLVPFLVFGTYGLVSIIETRGVNLGFANL